MRHVWIALAYGLIVTMPVHAQTKPAPGVKPSPASTSAQAANPATPPNFFEYAVTLEPPTWRNAVLAYTVQKQGATEQVHTAFRHAQGSMNFNLGAYRPNDPSHANTRFPGFFLHAVQFTGPLEKGRTIVWETAWQMPGGKAQFGRVRRYEAVVGGHESVRVRAGSFNAVRIDITIHYLDAGKSHARVRETVWYAEILKQVVRVERVGQSPDEASARIVAELSRYGRTGTGSSAARSSAAPTGSNARTSTSRQFLYDLKLEPDTWQGATLQVVRTQRGALFHTSGIVRHAKGTISLPLGNFARDDRAHGFVQFPGFVQYPAYFDRPVDTGATFVWEWGWPKNWKLSPPDGTLVLARVRRYTATVGPLEHIEVPAGKFEAHRIGVKIEYMEAGSVFATVTETLWYAASAQAIVRFERAGRAPDEIFQRIGAALTAIR